jgi:hypothetical protein
LAQVLLLALSRLPQADFRTCVMLVPDHLQASSTHRGFYT